MPRTQWHRRVGGLLGSLALLLGMAGTFAQPTHAAPAGQAMGGEAMVGIIVSIDEPTHRSGVTARRVLVRGWAADPASQRGTGVSRVDLYLDGGPDEGGFYVGQATYGRERPDVAAALGGERFLATGWDMIVDMARGPHTIVAVAAPTGSAPALVVPGVASVHATVGGTAGRTASGCGAGGYCTSDEGGEQSGNRPAWRSDPLYAGNLYVGSGAFGAGPTAPPYGWWDDLQDEMALYNLMYRSYAYPFPQRFFGNVPSLYNQGLLSTLSTQGTLALTGVGCTGPEFGGLGVLGLSVMGGYSFGFPQLPGIGITLSGTGNYGQPGRYFGPSGTFGAPLSIPFASASGIGQLYGTGFANAYNGGYNNWANILGGGTAGPGGSAGSAGARTISLGVAGQSVSPNFFVSGCNARI